MIILNEEKPNKQFYQIQKQKQAKKQIKQLQNKQNKILTTNLEILRDCQKFDQKLYNKQKNCLDTQKELLNNIPKKLEIEHNEQIIKPINKNKIKQALNQMENDKSPGIDGIPIKFYKTFYTIPLQMICYKFIIIFYSMN